MLDLWCHPTYLIGDFPFFPFLLNIVLELVLDDLQCIVLHTQYFHLSTLFFEKDNEIYRDVCMCVCVIKLPLSCLQGTGDTSQAP